MHAAIPGSLTLSLLAGALFGPYRGLALVIFTNLCGSSLCFAINTQVGRAIGYRLWPTKVRTVLALPEAHPSSSYAQTGVEDPRQVTVRLPSRHGDGDNLCRH